jgi:predicted glutamine amidotransferase
MCRLFAIKTKNKKTVEEALTAFRSLDVCGKLPDTITGGHRDGFGLIFYKDERIIKVFKECAPSSDSSVFDEALLYALEEEYDYIIAHIRKATIGFLNEKNLHPFVSGNNSFAHNGTVESFSETLPVDVLNQREGETDSELLFLSLLHASEGRIEEQSLVHFLQNVAKKFFLPSDEKLNTSLSSIVSNGKNLFATRLFSEIHAKALRMDFSGYYTLYATDLRDGYIISSEKVVESADGKTLLWTLLKNGETLVK